MPVDHHNLSRFDESQGPGWTRLVFPVAQCVKEEAARRRMQSKAPIRQPELMEGPPPYLQPEPNGFSPEFSRPLHAKSLGGGPPHLPQNVQPMNSTFGRFWPFQSLFG